jgi:hypothetical protein
MKTCLPALLGTLVLVGAAWADGVAGSGLVLVKKVQVTEYSALECVPTTVK